MDYLINVITVFAKTPTGQLTAFITGLLCFAILTNLITVMPLIFHLVIIRGIEKKIGQKLIFEDQWIVDPSWFGIWFVRPFSIAFYMVIRYLCWKIAKNPEAKKLYYSALEKVHYPIQTATRFEIVMSFLYMINTLMWPILLAIGVMLFSLGS